MKCKRCSADAVEGKKCCISCLAEQSKYQRKARRRKRRAGLCMWCNANALSGKRLCVEHDQSNRERKRGNSSSVDVSR